jgi:hypothetical protein
MSGTIVRTQIVPNNIDSLAIVMESSMDREKTFPSVILAIYSSKSNFRLSNFRLRFKIKVHVYKCASLLMILQLES